MKMPIAIPHQGSSCNMHKAACMSFKPAVMPAEHRVLALQDSKGSVIATSVGKRVLLLLLLLLLLLQCAGRSFHLSPLH